MQRQLQHLRLLVEEADFSSSISSKDDHAIKPEHIAQKNKEEQVEIRKTVSPSVHIDIQIHISPDSTANQIDQIFASMAKHLYASSKIN